VGEKPGMTAEEAEEEQKLTWLEVAAAAGRHSSMWIENWTGNDRGLGV
jgi:hypothetical protein